jgi:hypothetical protein
VTSTSRNVLAALALAVVKTLPTVGCVAYVTLLSPQACVGKAKDNVPATGREFT